MQKCKEGFTSPVIEPFLERVERFATVALNASDHAVVAEWIDFVVVEVEAARDSRFLPQHERGNRSSGRVSVLLQQLLKHRKRIPDSKTDVVVHAGVGRQPASKDRHVRRQRERNMAVRTLVKNRVVAKWLEVRSCHTFVAVRRQMI